MKLNLKTNWVILCGSAVPLRHQAVFFPVVQKTKRRSRLYSSNCVTHSRVSSFSMFYFKPGTRDGKTSHSSLRACSSSVTTSTTTSWPLICQTCWSTETSRRSHSCGARDRSPTSSTSRISTSTRDAPSTTSCSTRCSPLSCEITPVRRSTCRSRTSTGQCWMAALLICLERHLRLCYITYYAGKGNDMMWCNED